MARLVMVQIVGDKFREHIIQRNLNPICPYLIHDVENYDVLKAMGHNNASEFQSKYSTPITYI